MLPESGVVSKCLLTVTLFPCPAGVTVTKDVCTEELWAVVTLVPISQGAGICMEDLDILGIISVQFE